MSTPGRDWDNPEAMLGVDDALHRILTAVSPLESVPVSLSDCLGMVLAEDVLAADAVPPFQNSAMDGYALRSDDTAEPPVTLKVIATVAAGSSDRPVVGHGEAVRIMTGAPLPPGADAVIRFEETTSDQETCESPRVIVRRFVRPHENVRDEGEDVAAGSIALFAGTRLRPADIGVLATVNREAASVHRRPRVGVLSTGDELVDVGPELRWGTIRDSNSYMLAAAVTRVGGEAVRLGCSGDSAADLKAHLGMAGELDFLITSGGVSVGDFDLVKDVLRSEGEIEIWQVRIKPGKPLAFGRLAGTPLLGLPGNPAAAMVSFDQFARPAILKMLGRADVTIPAIAARLSERMENRGRRRHFVRGTVKRDSGSIFVQPSPVHGSAMLRSLAASNCYIVIPEDRDAVEPGEDVTVQLPDEGL